MTSPRDRALQGTLSSQRTITGTLGSRSSSASLKDDPVGAGLLIVGRVVNFRDHLRWLIHVAVRRRALVMHSKEQPRRYLGELLRSHGARSLSDKRYARRHLPDNCSIAGFDLVTFTSASAVLNSPRTFGPPPWPTCSRTPSSRVKAQPRADAATRANISPAGSLLRGRSTIRRRPRHRFQGKTVITRSVLVPSPPWPSHDRVLIGRRRRRPRAVSRADHQPRRSSDGSGGAPRKRVPIAISGGRSRRFGDVSGTRDSEPATPGPHRRAALIDPAQPTRT